MNTKKLFVLIDFSKFTANQLKLADAWAKAYDLELHIAHEQDVVTPALADPTLRTQIIFDVQGDIKNEFDKLRKSYLSPDTKHVFHLLQQGLIPFLEEHADKTSMVLMGLKGMGKLMQIFIGSTTLRIIESANCIVLATPVAFDAPLPARLIVGINNRYPINETALQSTLDLLAVRLKEIQFVTVLTDEDNKEDTETYLETLVARFGSRIAASSKIFEGGDAFGMIKSYVRSKEEAFLVLQKGSRTFQDKIFRKFVINELIYDGSLPLIILPS